MGRLAAAAAAALLLGSLPCPAFAAGECPEGDWFCERAPPAPPPSEPPPEAAPPPAPERPARPGDATLVPAPEPRHEVRIDVPEVRPAKPRRFRYREWGVNMHAAFGLMGNDA